MLVFLLWSNSVERRSTISTAYRACDVNETALTPQQQRRTQIHDIRKRVYLRQAVFVSCVFYCQIILSRSGLKVFLFFASIRRFKFEGANALCSQTAFAAIVGLVV